MSETLGLGVEELTEVIKNISEYINTQKENATFQPMSEDELKEQIKNDMAVPRDATRDIK